MHSPCPDVVRKWWFLSEECCCFLVNYFSNFNILWQFGKILKINLSRLCKNLSDLKRKWNIQNHQNSQSQDKRLISPLDLVCLTYKFQEHFATVIASPERSKTASIGDQTTPRQAQLHKFKVAERARAAAVEAFFFVLFFINWCDYDKLRGKQNFRVNES